MIIKFPCKDDIKEEKIDLEEVREFINQHKEFYKKTKGVALILLNEEDITMFTKGLSNLQLTGALEYLKINIQRG